MAEMTIEQQRALALAKARRRRQGEQPAAAAPASAAEPGQQPIDASTVFVDEMLFGLPGKAAAGMNALVRAPFTDKTIGEEYDSLRSQYKAGREKYAEENPVANTAASIGGAVYGGAATGNLALKGAQAVAPGLVSRLGGSFAGKIAGDAALGAGQGAATAYGHDEDMGTGALVGGAAGAVARPVMALGGSALNSVGGMLGLGNNSRARTALAEALARSGKSADDVVDDLTRAAADGQDVYTVADSLGNSGQRMLSGVVRSPGDERAAVVEALQRRQAGQGRRLQMALEEGFGNPQTQAQTEAALTALRSADADVNYGAARQAAGTVDPTAAIAKADDFLSPGGAGIPTSPLPDDSVESTVRRARGMLTDGQNIVSDFDTAFRTKVELDSMIERANPTVQRQLIPIRNELDKALETASQPYAQARNTFRQHSQDIEAANIGRQAAKAGRVEDNLDTFAKLTRPEQQASFRAGYVDPQIAQIQNAAGPMTNRARPLVTDATMAEFPAFAQPGKAPQLMDRINREQRMFETSAQALGGSRTADNLADIVDVQSFDPSMLGALATGNFKGAALQALTRSIQGVQGRNSQTRDLIAKALMTSSPQSARTVLDNAVKQGQISTEVRNAVVRALIGTTNASAAMAN